MLCLEISLALSPVRRGVVGVSDTFDPVAKGSNIALSNGNLTATNATNGAWASARSLRKKSSGKHYAEFVLGIVAYNGAVVWGLSDDAAVAASMATYVGNFASSAALMCNGGQRYVSGFTFATMPTPPNAATGLVLMLAVDVDAKKAWLGHTGSWLASGDPASGGNPTITWTASYANICAAIGLVAFSGVSTVATLRGPGAQTYSPPSGFSGW